MNKGKKSTKDTLAEVEHMGKLKGELEAEDKIREQQALAMVPKHLAPYSDGLPFSWERVIEETRFFLKHEIAAKFEIGKRLLLMKEMAGIKRGDNQSSTDGRFAPIGRQTFSEVLKEYFSGLSVRRANEYVLFARKATKKFKEWAEGGRNWKKALALLDTFDEKELKAMEDGEPVSGLLFDDIDTMSVTELRENLRKSHKKIDKGKKQVEAKDREIERLQQGYNPTEKQFHLMMESYRIQFDSLMDNLDPEITDLLTEQNEEGELKKINLTIRMKAHYLEILGYMKKSILGSLGMAEDIHGTADMIPENVWHPGDGTKIWDDAISQAPKGQ